MNQFTNSPRKSCLLIFKLFQLPKHRFKQHQNAPYSFHTFIFFSAVPTSKRSFRIVPECTIYLPCFQSFLSSSNVQSLYYKQCQNAIFSFFAFIFSQQFQLQNTVSNSARMSHLAFLLLKFSQQFQLPKHRFIELQNAPSIVLDFNMVSANPSSKRIFSYSVRMHHLLSLLSTFSHHFQLTKTSFKMRKNAPFSVKTVSAVPTLVYRSGLQVIRRHIVI